MESATTTPIVLTDPGVARHRLTSGRFWSSAARFGAALALVATGAAVFALAFRGTIDLVFNRLYGAHDVLAAFQILPWYARLAIPAMGGACAGLLGRFAGSMRGSQGVGQVMEAVALGNVHISLRLTIVKAFGSWVAIASGGSVGREGSVIQFGGGLGGAMARLFNLPEHQARSLIAAGSAAGFAAAYNTPFAAVLFVIEVVTGIMALDIIVPAIIATPIATATMRFVIGGGPIYGQHTWRTGSSVDLFAPAILGLLAGIAGPLFMGLLSRSEGWFERLPLSKPWRAGLGGLLVGALALGLPQVTGNGYEAINLILGGRVGMELLVVLLAGKALATTASVSSGSPGGVFTPTLFLGAALGSAVGHVAAQLGSPDAVATAQAFALVGMAALTAATTHAPMMAAVMICELTGDHTLVLPLLIATAVATLASRKLRPDSIYGEELSRQGKSWEFAVVGRPKGSCAIVSERR